MPEEVTETPTYSLYVGKKGGEFQFMCKVTEGNYFYAFLRENPNVYDLAWKHDDDFCYVIRRDGAQRGGEE